MHGKAVTMFVVGLLAIGGLAVAGCGGDDSTDATATTATTDTAVTEGDAAEGASPDDVYNDCTAAIEGTPAEATGEAACGQARDALQKCIDKAATLDGDAKEQALQLCQAAADQAIEQLSGQ